MASTSRTPFNEEPKLALVSARRRPSIKGTPLKQRVVTTAVALGLLVLVLKFLPPGTQHSQVRAAATQVQISPADLQLRDVQISKAPFVETLYLDGLVTNAGENWVTGAMAEVQFHDSQGQVVAKVQKPLAGISHGGSGVVRNEFAQNPIQPNEMRFFRIAVEHAPPGWNHEVPEVKVVAVNGR